MQNPGGCSRSYYNIAHRVTIIRDGKVLLTEKIDDIDKTNLIRLTYTHAVHSKEVQTKEANMVIILFEDSGPGISQDHQKEIFLPFFSTKVVTGRNMGLGLPLSYRIIQKYGGTITVENKKNNGCIFRLSLKAQEK